MDEQRCKHGNQWACGFCMAEAAPKCKHGNPFYCGFCLLETGHGRVTEAGLLPFGVPGNGVSQLVGAFSRRRA